MSIEILIGAVVVILVIGYIILKDSKNDSSIDDRTVEVTPAPVAEVSKSKPAKKASTKKSAKVDLDAMNKNDLLAHAKANGIKANASMNKAAILEAIKNA